MDDSLDSKQPLSKTTFAVLDVETTGLSPAYGDRVCEVACLRFCDGAELDRLESLIDPQRPISPGAFYVNRITSEMLRGQPTFDAVAARLLKVMEGAVLVAHNAPFDLGFLAAELEIARRPPLDCPVVDTLSLVRRAYRFSSNSLRAVAAALGVETPPTHRAMADVWVTFRVLEQLRHDLECRSGVATLGQLIEFQGGPIPYPTSRAVPLPPTIAEALATGGRVRMRYIDASGQGTNRIVRPLRVNAQGSNLYLIAHCYQRGELRTFRLDRVVEMALEE
jgi:DNA polymerase III epsilon subunit family exonuclease